MKIGIFDSGVGGKSVALKVQSALPEHEILLVEDSKNLPYGTKSPDQLLDLVLPILEYMVIDGCKVILIACNTVTTSIIGKLRDKITVPLVGMEPMIKPAASMTHTGTIAVFATPTTLSTERYAWLKDQYAKGIRVLEPDCSRWAKMIEDNSVDRQSIKDNVSYALDNNSDVLVLGCTHYHWIEDLIKELVGNKAEVIQPTEPVIMQLTKEIERLG